MRIQVKALPENFTKELTFQLNFELSGYGIWEIFGRVWKMKTEQVRAGYASTLTESFVKMVSEYQVGQKSWQAMVWEQLEKAR